MDYKVINFKWDNEFKVSPSSGYRNGFDSMFKKENDGTKWLFICPFCHSVFDIGYTVYSPMTNLTYRGTSWWTADHEPRLFGLNA